MPLPCLILFCRPQRKGEQSKAQQFKSSQFRLNIISPEPYCLNHESHTIRPIALGVLPSESILQSIDHRPPQVQLPEAAYFPDNVVLANTAANSSSPLAPENKVQYHDETNTGSIPSSGCYTAADSDEDPAVIGLNGYPELHLHAKFHIRRDAYEGDKVLPCDTVLSFDVPYLPTQDQKLHRIELKMLEQSLNIFKY